MNQAYLLFLILPALVLVAALVRPWVKRARGLSKTPTLILNAATLVGALAGVSFVWASQSEALGALIFSPWGAAIGGCLGCGVGGLLLRLQAAVPPWIPSHAAARGPQ